jgi:hypothetical protein
MRTDGVYKRWMLLEAAYKTQCLPNTWNIGSLSAAHAGQDYDSKQHNHKQQSFSYLFQQLDAAPDPATAYERPSNTDRPSAINRLPSAPAPRVSGHMRRQSKRSCMSVVKQGLLQSA